MVSIDLPNAEMIHYRFLQPADNEKDGQDSARLTVMSAFGSKQISFVRSEVRASTVPNNDLHAGWNPYDRMTEGVPPATRYEEGPHLDSHASRMVVRPHRQQRHIPMATVPKNGLICLTSFTDEKLPGFQRAAPTMEDFKTRLPATANAGINPCRSTSCHLVRDRFRRDLEKGQKILWANERLDNLHVQITKQVGEGTRQLQEGILEYVDKISTCFPKKNSYSLKQSSNKSASYMVEFTQGKQRNEETEEEKEEEEESEEEASINSSKKVKTENTGKKETGDLIREKTSGLYMEGEIKEKNSGEKPKKKEMNAEESVLEEDKEEETERADRKDRNSEDIDNIHKTETVSPLSHHQRSLQPPEDNRNIEAQDKERYFQYGIDSDITVASANSTPNPNQGPDSTTDSSLAKSGTLKFGSRRMTCPNIKFTSVSSGGSPDT